MTEWVVEDRSQSKLLAKCAALALVLEFVVLTAVGWHEHWLAHPQKTTGMDDQQFVEAQVFTMPTRSVLVEEKKISAPAPKPEATLSKVPNQGKTSKSSTTPIEEQNKTESGPAVAANHGPMAIFAPPPVIPTYLQNKELKTSVVIDFYVTNQGSVTPRLAGSSGSEELDAIALETVKKWQFRPAEKDHKPIDSKVRLRIIFEVK